MRWQWGIGDLMPHNERKGSENFRKGCVDMNMIERIQAVKAMEFLARRLNDEEIFEAWLVDGVADGDIEYGDLGLRSYDSEVLGYYIEDEHFAELMKLFLEIMNAALRDDSGLYCDGVVSK